LRNISKFFGRSQIGGSAPNLIYSPAVVTLSEREKPYSQTPGSETVDAKCVTEEDRKDTGDILFVIIWY
jgi:hypothetical protein